MARSRSPQHASQSLLYAVKQVELAVRAQLDEVLRPLGVSVWQYTALTVLEQRDGLTSAALARRSFVTAQTMGDVVTALERRELIERNPDPAHRKRLTISLTDAGRDLLAGVRDEVRAIEDRMTRGLTAEGRATLQQLLGTCLANLSWTSEDDPFGDAQRLGPPVREYTA
jgi:DNA-binding MarR family transcriptional regulator